MFASAGKTLHIYSLERGGLNAISKYASKSNSNIKHVSWCHDNNYMAILPENEYPQILSTKNPSQVTLVHTISSINEVTALKFKPNTKRVLALGTRNGEVVLYDTKNRCITKTLGQLSSEIRALEFNSVNQLAVISNESLVLFNLEDSERIDLCNPQICTALKCLNKTDSGEIAVGCLNGMVTIWDIHSKREKKVYRLHSAEISGIAISNKEKLIVSTGADNKICVIDHWKEECVFKKILHQPITSIDISTNEQHMVAGLKDGSIYVYQMDDHLKPQICSKMHPSCVSQISFVNGLIFDLLQSDSFMNDTEVNSITNKEMETITDRVSSVDLAEFTNKQSQLEPPVVDDVEVPEEKVKLDLIKLINIDFARLEDQMMDHCARLQTLVCTELDSLYAVAARWECFKTMELEEIVRYICGIVSVASETKIMCHKSEHTNLQQ